MRKFEKRTLDIAIRDFLNHIEGYFRDVNRPLLEFFKLRDYILSLYDLDFKIMQPLCKFWESRFDWMDMSFSLNITYESLSDLYPYLMKLKV